MRLKTIQNHTTKILQKDLLPSQIIICNRFIPNFAKLSQPLNQITRKTAIFDWSQECDESFHKIEKILLSPQILKY